MTDLAERIRGVETSRRDLARAITLVESTREDHRIAAVELLDAVLHRTGGAVRVAISGAPGVGKSTFIEALGLHLVGAGHRVAVLAVDPTSRRSGGSILGDKTRMAELARHEAAFVRPSPAGADLGGVARRTGEVLLLCEAAGYDVVLVETVGVGQSEVAVADLVDTFVLLVAAGGGDELQGVKRGIMELADVVVVTKADGDLAAAARRAEADHRHAVMFLRNRLRGWRPPVLSVSAVERSGIAEVWEAVEEHRAALVESGALEELRRDQRAIAFEQELTGELLARLRSSERAAAAVDEWRAAAVEARVSVRGAVRHALAHDVSG